MPYYLISKDFDETLIRNHKDNHYLLHPVQQLYEMKVIRYYTNVNLAPYTVGIYADAKTAHEANPDKSTHHVVFIATQAERNAWETREANRFADGTYIDVPWHRHITIALASHFAHMSLKDPGMIAYTRSEEHGVADRQTRVRPGRYLTEFYASILTAEQIEQYACACTADSLVLSIATTADDVERVYVGSVGGLQSCMTGSHGTPQSNSGGKNFHLEGYLRYATIHPTRVYGDSDLAVAYLGDIDCVTARCVVWPAKKRYGRIYGNESVLRALLTKDGYTSGSMIGARIRYIEDTKHRIVMPYIDGPSYAERDGQYLTLGSGSIETQVTSGYTDSPDDRDMRECDNCGDEYETDDDTGNYCQHCYDQMSSCFACDRQMFDVEYTDENDEPLCRYCARRQRVTCAVCSEVIYTSRATSVCSDCDRTYTYCSDCNSYYYDDNNECSCKSETNSTVSADTPIVSAPPPTTYRLETLYTNAVTWLPCYFPTTGPIQQLALSNTAEDLRPTMARLSASHPQNAYRIISNHDVVVGLIHSYVTIMPVVTEMEHPF